MRMNQDDKKAQDKTGRNTTMNRAQHGGTDLKEHKIESKTAPRQKSQTILPSTSKNTLNTIQTTKIMPKGTTNMAKNIETTSLQPNVQPNCSKIETQKKWRDNCPSSEKKQLQYQQKRYTNKNLTKIVASSKSQAKLPLSRFPLNSRAFFRPKVNTSTGKNKFEGQFPQELTRKLSQGQLVKQMNPHQQDIDVFSLKPLEPINRHKLRLEVTVEFPRIKFENLILKSRSSIVGRLSQNNIISQERCIAQQDSIHLIKKDTQSYLKTRIHINSDSAAKQSHIKTTQLLKNDTIKTNCREAMSDGNTVKMAPQQQRTKVRSDINTNQSHTTQHSPKTQQFEQLKVLETLKQHQYYKQTVQNVDPSKIQSHQSMTLPSYPCYLVLPNDKLPTFWLPCDIGTFLKQQEQLADNHETNQLHGLNQIRISRTNIYHQPKNYQICMQSLPERTIIRAEEQFSEMLRHRALCSEEIDINVN